MFLQLSFEKHQSPGASGRPISIQLAQRLYPIRTGLQCSINVPCFTCGQLEHIRAVHASRQPFKSSYPEFHNRQKSVTLRKNLRWQKSPPACPMGNPRLDCPAQTEQVYLPTNVEVTKGCRLPPPFNIFVPCSIIDLAPQERRVRPSTLPAPLRANLFDNLATVPCWRRACDVCCSVPPIPPWGTCASHGASRYRDRPDVLRRAQQTQSLHLQLFHRTACCGRAPRDSDEDTCR
jgi:hypothetical protein